MIVPMKHITLVCLASVRRGALEALGRLGVLHIELAIKDSAEWRKASEVATTLEQSLRLLKAIDTNESLPAVGTSSEKSSLQIDRWLKEPLPTIAGDAEAVASGILSLGEGYGLLANEQARLEKLLALYAPFGDFDLATVQAVAGSGLAVRLFVADGEQLPQAEVVRVLGTSPEGKRCGVVIGACDLPAVKCRELPWPAQSPEALRQRVQAISARQSELVEALRTLLTQRSKLELALANSREQCEFELVAANQHVAKESLAWLVGYLPCDSIERLREEAQAQGWGLAVRDPLPDELPPTLLRPPRLFRPITTLFAALGITPGYRETDVSVPFYIFFTIFFAMLVGDAGYGALLLGLTIWAARKWKQAPRAPFILLGVFSLATMAWGILSGVYFGIPSAVLPNWLNHPVAQWLAVQDNIMQLCFTLGAAHLILARLWNAAQLFPSTKALAQIGWCGVLVGMYNIICSVVVAGFTVPGWNTWVLGAGVALIALFMCTKNELKDHVVDFGMLPLNVIGSMGDIISYVRLFAVGMASVKVAENFDIMATSLDLPMALKIPAMIVILFLGHGMNLLMGALSILVHAVRLNTLEFSGAKGLTWAGIVYRPFRRKS